MGLKDDLQKLRLLDMDDWIILEFLGAGAAYGVICKFLLISQPAISHRLHKYKRVWGDEFVISSGVNERTMSPLARKVCDSAHRILASLSTEQ